MLKKLVRFSPLCIAEDLTDISITPSKQMKWFIFTGVVVLSQATLDPKRLETNIRKELN